MVDEVDDDTPIDRDIIDEVVDELDIDIQFEVLDALDNEKIELRVHILIQVEVEGELELIDLLEITVVCDDIEDVEYRVILMELVNGMHLDELDITDIIVWHTIQHKLGVQH